MNWFTDPAQLCATLDLETQEGLAEAILISVASLKDSDGKMLHIKFGNTTEDDINFARQIASTLLSARAIRGER